MTSVFINRPILSVVLSVILTLLGLLSLTKLPVSQFPGIAPPEVNVTVEYAGANAETLTKAAMVKLERSINGVPGMKYMSTDVGNDGVGVVQIIFEVGTNPDTASVNVQNRVAAIMGQLPAEVVRNGVKIAKEENAMLMYLNIFSTRSDVDEKFLYNFADLNILSELKRIKGVGYADILGAKEYAMRVWLKPDKLLALNVSANDVMTALEEQNVEAAPGKVGESSEKGRPQLQYVVRYTGKFTTEEEYRNIPLRSTSEGQILRLRDVAEIEFGTTYFDVEARFNGRPAAAIMLKQIPGSNASEVIAAVKQRMAEIRESTFLEGMDYEISYDVSRFLDASLHEVLRTLLEAFVLVSLVTYVFLQDWRSTVVPVLAVPVSLVGTFVFMHMIGFSLNLVTLFALVLAIGIVVDDAIVVVEAVHAQMERGSGGARQATERAMHEISGALIAITLVMAAVFVPVAFMSGPSGILYRNFAITIAIAISLSGFVALTLTPTLCALLLKNSHHQPHDSAQAPKRRGPLAWFFHAFNSTYERLASSYTAMIRGIAGRRALTCLMLLGFCAATGWVSRQVPTGFIPNEDQGSFYISITTPSGATLERTKDVVDEIVRCIGGLPGISSVSSLSGTNILSDGTGASYGTCLVNLVPWDQRSATVETVMNDVRQKISHLKDARIEIFPPPPVPGYGNAGGFELRLLDKTGSGDFQRMDAVLKQFMADLRQRPEIGSVFTIFDASYPQYLLHVDMDKAAQKGVTVSRAMAELQTLLGSEYGSNFIRFGQMYRVMVQALPQYRARPEDILKLSVKASNDQMVMLSSFITLEKVYGVDQVTRYNMFPSAELNGEQSPGYSSGDAIRAIQETVKDKLPKGYGIDWAGMTRDEVNVGNEATFIFIICIVFVYLLLAAQYESLLLPLPVILSLPTGLVGAFLFLQWMGLENNIYAQVAMIMLIGLLGKNAILIVEFAALRHREGKTPLLAAVEAVRTRLRPILMTSMVFVAGLMPLLLASGVGAVGNRTIGAAATGGMIFGTVFGVILTPGLYVIFATLAEKFSRRREELPLSETL
ncbi:efflux RND transporter permease subunit [Prosthecobacter fluviatilis]|uniref:Efflux RND transporter permease subunit n=1 Tax=Prosthecobacter fluviatilis TaxID=445931 RepID=A0ABW0KUS0_9BACT